MKKKSINKSRIIIKRYCDDFIAAGGIIRPGSFNEYSATSYKPIAHCAMGVIGYPNNSCGNSKTSCVSQMEIIQKTLGWEEKEIWSFIAGFDNSETLEKKSKKHFELGQEFRKFYVTKEINKL